MATPSLTHPPESFIGSLLLCGDTEIAIEEGQGNVKESVFVFPPFVLGGPSLFHCGASLDPSSFEDWELGCSTIYCNSSGIWIRSGEDGSSSEAEEGMVPAVPFVDPYHVLQVRRDATPLEIRQAYQRLALWHHPGRSTMDVVSPQERARRRQVFEVLAACYETLMDKPTRARFDALLKEAEPAGTSGATPSSQSHLFSPPSQRRNSRRLRTKSRAHQTAAVEIPTLLSASVDYSSSSSSDYGGDGSCLDSHSDDDASGKSYHKVNTEDAKACEDMHSCHSRKSVRPQRKHERKKPSNLDTASTTQYAKSLRQFLFGVAPSISVEDDDDEGQLEQSSVHRHLDQRRKLRGRSFAHLHQPSSSSAEEKEFHYSERETNRLFGGPLTLLFRARQWKPLTDPYQVFADVFGRNLSPPSKPGSQSSTHLIRALQPTSPAAVIPIRPSAPTSWTTTTTTTTPTTSTTMGTKGSATETTPPTQQIVVCTTTRTLHDRILTRTETICQQLGGPQHPGQQRWRRRHRGSAGPDEDWKTTGGEAGAFRCRSRQITVTSEPIHTLDGKADASSAAWCGSWSSPWNTNQASHCDFQLCVWE